MPGQNRSAFTLVELLVVVVIITILVGLLIPAVIGARESARQTQCSNHQRELGVAVHNHQSSADSLMGYVDYFGRSINTARLSWIVLLFPHLGREDLWAEWRDPSLTYNQKRSGAMVDLGQLRCPSASRSGQGALSYVANCGIQSLTATPSAGGPIPEGQAHGLFRNRHDANPPTFTTDRIPDGASNTLMLSESVQATLWGPPLINNSNAETWTGLVDPTTDLREVHVCFVWTPNAPRKCQGINQCKDAEISLYASGAPLNPPVPKPPYDTVPLMDFARPTSYHVGGVMTTLADGSQSFKDEGMDYQVFRQLMASEDSRIGL